MTPVPATVWLAVGSLGEVEWHDLDRWMTPYQEIALARGSGIDGSYA